MGYLQIVYYKDEQNTQQKQIVQDEFERCENGTSIDVFDNLQILPNSINRNVNFHLTQNNFICKEMSFPNEIKILNSSKWLISIILHSAVTNII